ncbi:hypothetical protein RCOM_0898310 [Ricinus communis]|uniref:NB-ARC domain-containing protein n=1 Tax=Ricinus communis TaxID=3988 RepID=B9RV26_RICCO|nr:hypothetical protein RCOM_0898310 [Ricinus communis]
METLKRPSDHLKSRVESAEGGGMVDFEVATPGAGMFGKAWSCLEEDSANIVGIYGKGGIGKTTVLTQISNNLLTSHPQIHFDFALWIMFDLTEVGVPTPNRENSSKLMFATRIEEEKVREETLNIHLEIPQLAQTIAKICDGLTLALITVGRTMASTKT